MTAKPAVALTAAPTLPTIRISAAGSCPRRLLLEARGVEGKPPWAGMERAFAEGNLHEASILEWAAANLPGGPYEQHFQQSEVRLDWHDTPLLVGHPDAIAIRGWNPAGLLEAKCLSQRAFQEFREKGVRESHPQYYAQVQLYVEAWNVTWGQDDKYRLWLEGGWLVARNKETPKSRMWDHHYEWIEYDPAFCERECKRLAELQATIANGGNIEPPYNPTDNWQCRQPWCPYTYDCHPDYRKPAEGFVRQDELEAAVVRYREIGDELSDLNAERDALKAQLEATAAKSPVLAGSWQVQLVSQRRESFDTKLARKELAPDILAKLLRVTEFTQLKIEEAL